ncbi:MAG: iron ABC transporter permease, partial [Chloroflexota bacterium]
SITIGPGVWGRARVVLAWWPAWLLTGVLCLIILYPMVVLFASSFLADGALTLSAYQKAFSSPETFQLIWTTLWLALVRVGLGAALGILLAWLIARTDLPGRGAIEVLIWIELFAPPLPMLLAWVLIAGKGGLVNALLQQPLLDVYSYGGIVWVSSLGVAAFICLTTLPAFRAIDVTLEDAAHLCGAGRWHVLRDVTVPVLLPAILGSVLFALVFVLESFETELILGTPGRIYVLSTRIFTLSQEYPQDLPGATALSSVLLLAVALIFVAQFLALRGKRFTTISGKGHSARPIALGRWRWAALAVCAGYLFLALLLPFTVLVMGSFMKAWGVWNTSSFTLDHWLGALDDPRLLRAMGNTVVVGVAVGLAGTFTAAITAYLAIRTRFRGGPFLEFLSWVPRTAPGVVLAIAFVWSYVGGAGLFKPLAGTVGMLIVVLAVAGLPLATRVVNGAMHQVDAELEEAARVAASNWLSAFCKVLIPLMAPALLTCFVLVFL